VMNYECIHLSLPQYTVYKVYAGVECIVYTVLHTVDTVYTDMYWYV